MAKIVIIAAIGKNNELGKSNGLIWHLSEDLKFFREQTTNHKIVMGYNTFKSLPRLLPRREHIVLTHKDIAIAGVKAFHDFKVLTEYLKTINEEVYIIGGSSIYSLFIDIADELILTEIDDEYPQADVYFPPFNKENYNQTMLKECEEDGIKYRHIKYIRRPKYAISCEEYFGVDDSTDLAKQVKILSKVKK